MEIFDFPNHTVTHVYPKGDSFKFGNGYEFAAKPFGPPQRTFKLTFEAMVWFLNDDGSADTATEPGINMQRLIEFYEEHQTWKKFLYPHPVYGTLIVRFKEPLETPQSLKNAAGATDKLELTLVEQPL
jgi:phage-related protein